MGDQSTRQSVLDQAQVDDVVRVLRPDPRALELAVDGLERDPGDPHTGALPGRAATLPRVDLLADIGPDAPDAPRLLGRRP